MASQSVDFLPVNQNLQPLHLWNVGFQGSRNRVYRELFALNSRRGGGGKRLRKIGNACSVRQQIKRQQGRIRRQSAQVGVYRTGEQSVQYLFGAKDGVRRKC